jgi:hypothetical protein
MNRADLVYAVCHLLGLRPSHEPTALPLPIGSRGGVSPRWKLIAGGS